jgi:hypothetical protein
MQPEFRAGLTAVYELVPGTGVRGRRFPAVSDAATRGGHCHAQ